MSEAHRRPLAGALAPVREALRHALAGALAIAVALWLGAFSLAQASSERVALPALERTAAALTQLDALVELHAQTLQEAADSGATALLPPGFPIRDAAVPARAVVRDGRVDLALLRDTLRRNAARLLYERGADAFTPPDGDGGLRSTGLLRALLRMAGSGTHELALALSWLLGAVAATLAAALLAVTPGPRRLRALGRALLGAAAIVFAAALVARAALALGSADEGDTLFAEALAIAQGLLTLPLRDALWVALAGAALTLPAARGERLIRS
ncbi:MAG: hypothetical protein EXR65_02235 [Dehalococcoidia bacterium]|nr:hypothetical protein [Dehalococcoidia bacterium]